MACNDSVKDVVEKLCGRLNLSSLHHQIFSNIHILKENFHLESFELNEEGIACIVYISMIESRFVYGSLESQLLNSGSMPSTVTHLLKAANVRVCEFLKKMKILQDALPLSDAVGQHLALVQRKFLISCPLYRKFEKMYLGIFFDGRLNSQNPSLEASHLSEKRLCWLIFITIKASIQQQEESLKLTESFHLLLCCMERTIWNASPSDLHFPFDSFREMAYSDNDKILLKLCQRYEANIDEVKFVKSNYFEPELQNLYLLGEDISIPHLVEVYSDLHQQLGDINELDFLENEFYLTTHSPQPSTSEANSKHVINTDTPVRQAMTRIQGLKNCFKMVSSQPSQELSEYFKECRVNPHHDIEKLLHETENLFVDGYSRTIRRKGIARSRFKNATFIYYDVLKAIIEFDKERMAEKKFILLNDQVFNKSLIACSLEVILCVYECHTFPFATSFPAISQAPIANFAFPWILNVLDLQGFDFFRVVDSFIQVKQDIPADIKDHLKKIEEQIVSYVGWQTGSPVFGINPDSVEPMEESTTHLRILKGESFPLSNQSNFIKQAYHDSPRRPRPISIFVNKARRVACKRLMLLVSSLKIPSNIASKIAECFNYCLQNKPDLFKDRHIDQILMCCLYGVPKIHGQEVKFKDIIVAYKGSVDGTLLKLDKNVLIANGERGLIIQFYNKIFVPELRNYLINLNPHHPDHNPLTPQDGDIQTAPSEQVLTPNKTALNSPFKVPLTPRTMTLYCFKDSPLGSLKLVSKSAPVRKCGATKRLKFNHFEVDAEQHESIE